MWPFVAQLALRNYCIDNSHCLDPGHARKLGPALDKKDWDALWAKFHWFDALNPPRCFTQARKAFGRDLSEAEEYELVKGYLAQLPKQEPEAPPAKKQRVARKPVIRRVKELASSDEEEVHFIDDSPAPRPKTRSMETEWAEKRLDAMVEEPRRQSPPVKQRTAEESDASLLVPLATRIKNAPSKVPADDDDESVVEVRARRKTAPVETLTQHYHHLAAVKRADRVKAVEKEEKDMLDKHGSHVLRAEAKSDDEDAESSDGLAPEYESGDEMSVYSAKDYPANDPNATRFADESNSSESDEEETSDDGAEGETDSEDDEVIHDDPAQGIGRRHVPRVPVDQNPPPRRQNDLPGVLPDRPPYDGEPCFACRRICPIAEFGAFRWEFGRCAKCSKHGVPTELPINQGRDYDPCFQCGHFQNPEQFRTEGKCVRHHVWKADADMAVN